jgi:hypothetical protein
MDDQAIMDQIERLEEEREAIRSREGEGDPQLEADVARVEEIRVELDRLYDLKRQRQALRDAGRNPDDAQERPADTVEKYLQ